MMMIFYIFCSCLMLYFKKCLASSFFKNCFACAFGIQIFKTLILHSFFPFFFILKKMGNSISWNNSTKTQCGLDAF